MIRISTEGADLLGTKLSNIEKRQLPFATALALNRTAQDVKAAEVKAMKADFDRPTAFTLNSLFIKPAKKNRLEAMVWVKDYAAKAQAPTRWLLPEVMGGGRGHKRSEGLLSARGILPSGKALMPGKGMKLDGHGNISRGQLQKILSGLGAQGDKLTNSTDSKRSSGNQKSFFVLGKGSGAMGIAQRTGKKSIQMLLAFGKTPSYSSLLDFFGIAGRVIHQRLPGHLRETLNEAVLSAK
jgi:hypothetical protein